MTRSRRFSRRQKTNRRRQSHRIEPGIIQSESLEDRRLLTVLLADSFEVGEWNGVWAEDGQNDWKRSTQRESEGSYSAEVDGYASNATLSLANLIDLTTYESAELTFSWYIESGFDRGEYIALDFFDGTNWNQIASLDGNVDQENTWHNETITIDGSYLTSDFQLRFRAKVSSSREDGFVDNVKIEGTPANTGPVGLVSHWTAENNALDVNGDNDGTVVSGAAYTTGQIGQALSFDGVNDRVLVADSPSLRLTESMTIEGWVKVDSFTSGDGFVLFRGDDRGGLDPYQLRTRFDGTIQFQIESLTNAASVVSPMPVGEFVYVAATLDDATGQMNLYLNGVLMAQKVTTVRPFGALDPNSNPGVGIGNHGGYPSTPHNFPFHGAIDELKLHDVPLSDAEILANFNAGKGNLQPSISIDDGSVIEGDLGYTFTDAFVSSGIGGLASPRGMTFGPDGNLYVSSYDTHEILRYNGTTGAFIDEFVTGGAGGLQYPRDLDFHDGNLFVASVLTNSVLRFDGSTGAFVDEFIPSGSGGLEQPRGLLFGPGNELYVTSSALDDAVLRYDATTGAFIDEFIASGDNGLDNPTRITIGPDGNFYVSSTNASSSSVLRYDSNGNFVDTFIDAGVGGLSGPTDLVFQSGLLYVASARTDSVLAYDQITGDFDSVVVPTGGGGLDNPNTILFDGNGLLYVTSKSTNEVLRFDVGNSAVMTVSLSSPSPETVTVDYSTTDGTALTGSDYESTTGTVTFASGVTSQTVLIPIIADAFAEPDETFDLTLEGAVNASITDPSGTVTIVEHRLAVSDATVIEGATSVHYRGAIATGNPGAHFNPLTIGPDGDIYTAVGTGSGYNTIQRFSGTTGAFIETFMDNSDLDHKINGVRDIVFHPTDGKVYVASSYTDEVLRYDAATGDFFDVFVSASSGGIDHPDGMQFGPDSNQDGKPELYVTSWLSHSVVRYDGATGAPLGTYVTAASGGLNSPFSLAFRNDELFVTSAGTDQILKYDADDGSYLGIVTGFGLDYPRGLTFGPDDLLYVTSGDNDRILRFTPQGQYVDDFVLPGAAGMDNPRTPRFGPEGDLYVTATGNNEIMRFGDTNDAIFTVSLSTASTETLTIDYATTSAGGNPATEGADYEDVTGQVIFSPGQTERVVVVPIIDDLDAETDETFEISIALSAGSPEGIVVLDGVGVGTIVDDGDPAPPNESPVADDDSYVVAEDAVLSVAPPGVLDGDTDTEGDSLTAVLVAQATGGVVALNADGSFTYTPDTDFNGSDIFTYIANDGTSNSNVATVNLTVTPVNDAPVANGQSLSTNEDNSVAVTLAGSDIEGDPLTFIVQNGPTSGSLSGTAPALTYTPNPGFTGADSFTFISNDGVANSAAATVTIVVNEIVNVPPTANAGANQTLSDGDGNLDALATLTGSGSDSDGTITGYQWTNGATVLGNSASISTTLGVGTHTLTLTVTDDGGATASDSVVVTVNPNQGPTANAGSDQIVTDGTAVTLNGSGSDSDGSIVSYQWTDGTTVVGNTASISPTLTVGVHNLTLTVTDNGGSTASDTVMVTVNPIVVASTKFYVVDTSVDDMFEYKEDGTLVENYNLGSGNNAPRGVAADITGDTVWVIDNDDYVYVHDNDGNLLRSWKASGLIRPEGIASNGTDIWIVDRGNDRVHYFAGGATRTTNTGATSSFSLVAGNPRGITTDGTHLWVVDTGTDDVYKYTTGGTFLGNWALDSRNTVPRGITIDPANVNDIWVVDSTDDSVYKYSGAANRTSGSQSAAEVFGLATGNTNPQGIADPPPGDVLKSSADGSVADDSGRPSVSALRQRIDTDLFGGSDTVSQRMTELPTTFSTWLGHIKRESRSELFSGPKTLKLDAAFSSIETSDHVDVDSSDTEFGGWLDILADDVAEMLHR